LKGYQNQKWYYLWRKWVAYRNRKEEIHLNMWEKTAPTRKTLMSNATDAESLDICPRAAGVKDQGSE
jgi:hypothetical protein